MRIGIVSDTHGLLRKEVIEDLKGVDHIIHAGDIDKKEVLDELEKIAPVTAVRGNADKDWAEYLPEKALLEFEGNKIYVIHNKGKIDDFIMDLPIIIYGHSHKYVIGDFAFDLTSEQFGDEKLDYTDNPEQFREVHFAKEEKRLRYEFLKKRLKEKDE